jgi:hypothetical protein
MGNNFCLKPEVYAITNRFAGAQNRQIYLDIITAVFSCPDTEQAPTTFQNFQKVSDLG